MKNICVLGAGGSSINIIKEIATQVNIEKIKDTTNIKYGLISTSLEDIHRAQDYGLDILINKQVNSNQDVYEPVINREITREIEYLAIGEKECKGLGTSASIEKAENAFYESEKNIDVFLKRLLDNIDLVIFVTSFGGGNGTGLIPLLVQKVKDMDIENISIIGKPFDFEGEKRLDNFNKGIEKLKNKTNESIIIDSNSNEESVIEKFKERDKEFAKVVFKIIRELEME